MLAKFSEKNNIKIIQIATDCVFSGVEGQYTENSLHDSIDVYGKTKSLGEVYSKNLLNIRCSIIGPEKYRKDYLLEWVINHPKGSVLNGYSHHNWNGVTTLQFAKICKAVIENDNFNDLLNESSIYHLVPNSKVTKYELLNLINKTFSRHLVISKLENENIVDRTLETIYPNFTSMIPSLEMEAALVELTNYIKGKDYKH